MINNLAQFTALFYQITEEHPELNDFLFGNHERILARHRSETEYPILFLEIPSVSNIDKQSGLIKLKSAFAILKKTAGDDWTQQDVLLTESLAIGLSIINTLQLKNDAGTIVFDTQRVAAEPIMKWTADDDWGYRFAFEIQIELSCTGEISPNSYYWTAPNGEKYTNK